MFMYNHTTFWSRESGSALDVFRGVQKVAGFSTEEQIAAMDEIQYCYDMKYSTYKDPGIVAHGKEKNFLCSPIEKNCRDRGYKIDSANFSQCVEKDTELELRKLRDPAFAYCLDRGFKQGISAISKCMMEKDQILA